MNGIEKYLTIDEVGEILEVSRQAVFEWVQDGRLKHYRAGRGIRIRPEDVIEYLEKLRNPSTAITMFQCKIEAFLLNKYKVTSINGEEEERESEQTCVENSKSKIRFLINGMRHTETIPSKYRNELRESMDLLQLFINEIEYHKFMGECLGLDPGEVTQEFLKLKLRVIEGGGKA